MNTHQLNIMAGSCPDIAPTFLGIFPSDTLPPSVPRPSSLIANLDTSNQAGSHWVAFYFPSRGLPEYMDSYGLPPLPQFKHFVKYNYRCNKEFLQSPFSAVCGQYCLYYLLKRNRLPSMNSVLSVFKSDDCYYNDVLVNDAINKHFSVDLKMFDVEWQIHQLCRAYA